MIDLRKHLSVISKIKDTLSTTNSKILFLTVSGAHLYGFLSKDSDTDYRGTFVTGTENLLGLKTPEDVIELDYPEGNPSGIVLFELKKEIDLALSGNCNVIEHINAPPILSGTESIKLKRLVNNAFGKNGIYNSYKGMAEFNYKKFILQGKSTVKKYLYVFRGLMAGIYVLETGIIKPDITELNKYFKIKEVNKLIALKKSGAETEAVPKDLDTGKLETIINGLFERIDRSYSKSKIPERPEKEDIEALDMFLKSVRRDNL
jgi:hypothetical protein